MCDVEVVTLERWKKGGRKWREEGEMEEYLKPERGEGSAVRGIEGRGR